MAYCTSTPASRVCRRRGGWVLLNLKIGSALRMHSRNSAELRLHKKGPGPVPPATSRPITISRSSIPISSSANLTKARRANMMLKIERGRGYRPAVQRVAFEEQ